MSQFRHLPEDVIENHILPQLSDKDAIALMDEICPTCFYKLKDMYSMSEWLKMPQNFIPTRINYDLETTEELALLPNNLEYLQLGRAPEISDIDIELPKGLKGLSLDVDFKGTILAFPETLKYLTLYEPDSDFPLPPLPTGLKELLIGLIKIDDFKLPDGLTELDIELSEVAIPNPLPSKLKILKLSEYDFPLVNLPTDLKELHVTYTDNLRLPTSLPRNLEVLNLQGSSVNRLPPLPSTLKSLTFPDQLDDLPDTYPPNLQKLYAPFGFFLRIHAHLLPKTLEVIEFTAEYDADREVYLRFPNLKKLVIGKLGIVPRPKNLNAEFY